jgi:toxin ParE1/3/4
VLSLKIRPKARRDLAYIAAWISLDDPAAGLAFRAAAEREVEVLRVHPLLGWPHRFRRKGLRSWRVGNFEDFLIFYRPTRTSIEVVRVLHGAQDLQRILGSQKRS